MRQSLVVALVAFALPLAAHAQWASSLIEHEWLITIGGNSYGLVQRVTDSAGVRRERTTTVCLGSYTTTTRVRAAYLALLMLLPVGALGVVLLPRLSPGKSGS